MSAFKIKIDPELLHIIVTSDGAVYLAERLPMGFCTVTDPREIFLPSYVRDYGTAKELVAKLNAHEILASRLTSSIAFDLADLLTKYKNLLGERP